jgi:hypothetical protein
MVHSTSQPVLTGPGSALSYSATAKRWLPVPATSVSADGLRYAYTDQWSGGAPTMRLHVVDIATGKEATHPLPSDPYTVLKFARSGVQLMLAYEGTSGLWRLDPATGGFTRVANVTDVWASDGEVVWAGSVNPTDQRPLEGLQRQPNQVDRVSIADGLRQPWLYSPSTALHVAGLDGRGRPLVWVDRGKSNGGVLTGSDSGALVLLTGPNQARTLYSGDGLSKFRPDALDGHGLWLGGPDGIYLLEDGGPLRKVSGVAGRPAGGCI